MLRDRVKSTSSCLGKKLNEMKGERQGDRKDRCVGGKKRGGQSHTGKQHMLSIVHVKRITQQHHIMHRKGGWERGR